MVKIIAVVNQKGGVGKTATSYNTCYGLSTMGQRTLLVDIDPSQNATKPLCPKIPAEPTIKEVLLYKDFDPNMAIIQANINDQLIENLFLIPSRIQLATTQKQIASKAHHEKILYKQLQKVADKFDYIIIDCPPMLGEFTVNAVYAADFFIIPIKYEEDALDGISDLFDIIKEVKELPYFEYKILRNGCDGRKKTVNAYIEERLAPFIERNTVFKTVIRQDEEINKAKISYQPVLTFEPKAAGSEDYICLAKEIMSG
jgi:chromosome partitioning protein